MNQFKLVISLTVLAICLKNVSNVVEIETNAYDNSPSKSKYNSQKSLIDIIFRESWILPAGSSPEFVYPDGQVSQYKPDKSK